ncbi:hypothetical protein NKH18_11460 [Streptomyces sp. M10(2022)]
MLTATPEWAAPPSSGTPPPPTAPGAKGPCCTPPRPLGTATALQRTARTALLGAGPTALPARPDTGPRHHPGELLDLLRGIGAGRPLLVCVDDAHAWDPDSRAALGFAARRLGAGSRVAVVAGAADEISFAGLPALRLGPLHDDAATALLDRLTDGADDIDPVVRGELLREAAGNPGCSPDSPAASPRPVGRAHRAAVSAARR